MKQVEVYTDGACSGNPGPGGWGAVLRYRFNGKVYEKELSGGDASTTNNRMELTAFIEALRQLKEPCEVRLCSDSQYVINGLEKGWARGWKRRGWKKSDGSPALNPDLWEQALEQEARHKITYVWVKGHAGHPENERCDQLAVAQSQAHGGTMSDTFLPGSGFDTYEQQDKVLVGLCGGTGCKAAVRILQQQGFAVMGAVVRLCTDDPVVDAAKEAAKALGIECITLNASELASQLAEETAAPADLRFPALLAAADRLGIQYIATGHRARVETGADGVHVLCPAEIADESARLAALPQETLGRLILPLGDFSPEDVAEMAAE